MKVTKGDPTKFSFLLEVEIPIEQKLSLEEVSKLPLDKLVKTANITFVLDLNPDNHIFEPNVPVLHEKLLEYGLKRVLRQVQLLSKSDNLPYPANRISKVVFSKNSPAMGSVSFLASTNGDVQPPKTGGGR